MLRGQIFLKIISLESTSVSAGWRPLPNVSDVLNLVMMWSGKFFILSGRKVKRKTRNLNLKLMHVVTKLRLNLPSTKS